MQPFTTLGATIDSLPGALRQRYVPTSDTVPTCRLSSRQTISITPATSSRTTTASTFLKRGGLVRRPCRTQTTSFSSAEQGTAATAPTHPSGSSIHVKVIGVGQRGISGVQKLASSEGFAATSELWCIDVDPAAMEPVASVAKTLVVPKEGGGAGNRGQGGPLTYDEVREIVGRGASDAGGRGNVGSATDGGVAFILAPASSIPGGPELLLQLVSSLRAAGHFTVVAVTLPFAFEGPSKQQHAADVIAALQNTAHVVAMTEQEVLMQAFGESQLTVAEATDIADSALEHTARCILQAVRSHELLKSSQGGLMWHGRDLRHFRRLLSPPLQQLLTSPGTGVLGRGLATLPAQASNQMGATQALMHLSSDAVVAASESPFLDGVLDSASAVLCCVRLPALGQRFTTGGGNAPLLSEDPEEARQMIRMAAQAAAGALRSVIGRGCDDFVLSVESVATPMAGQSTATHISVEATLLVLRPPGVALTFKSGGSSSSSGGNSNGKFQGGATVSSNIRNVPNNTATAEENEKVGISGRSYFQPKQPPPPPRQQNQGAGKDSAGGRLPSSTWSMLSAMAGGGNKGANKDAAGKKEGDTSKEKNKKQPQAISPLQGIAKSAAATPKVKPVQVVRPSPAELAKAKAAASAPPPSSQQSKSSSGTNNTNNTAQQQPKPTPKPVERVTVGDYLADSLTAQSLDLPPVAAKWRQTQRTDPLAAKRRLIVWEAQGEESDSESDEDEYDDGIGLFRGGSGIGGKKGREVNIKDRMSSILAMDREDSWDEPFQPPK